jgi:hypothetical protein
MTKSKLRHPFRQASSALRASTTGPFATFRARGWRSQSVLPSVSLREIFVPPGSKPSAALFPRRGELSRATPRLVEPLNEIDPYRAKFSPNLNRIGLLHEALLTIRTALIYDPEGNQEGLPPVLLARLPSDLVDVLILFAMRWNAGRKWNAQTRNCSNAIFRPFVLYWLIFVADDRKAARCAFTRALEPNWTFDQQAIRALIHEFEGHRIARIAPSTGLLGYLYQEVDRGGYELRAWEKRFNGADYDSNDEPMPGDALRVLSTSQELIKRALMWLQRSYIDAMFPHYDPPSDRDEDLPIDLDHLVPRPNFNFDWCQRGTRLGKDVISDDAASDNFRWRRSMVGDSLGNFRWVAFADKQLRGKGRYEPVDDSELVICPASWNRLIGKPSWSKDDIASFQRLIDRRTLDLYRKLVTDSAIERLLLQ